MRIVTPRTQTPQVQARKAKLERLIQSVDAANALRDCAGWEWYEATMQHEMQRLDRTLHAGAGKLTERDFDALIARRSALEQALQIVLGAEDRARKFIANTTEDTPNE